MLQGMSERSSEVVEPVGSARDSVKTLHWRWLALLILSAIALYWQALGTYFAVDDFNFIKRVDKSGMFLPSLEDFFARRYLNEVVLFAAAKAVFGKMWWGYHLLALAMHLLCGWFVYRIAVRLRPRSAELAKVTAAIFVLHPIAYTVIAWAAVGFNEPFALGLALIGALSFLDLIDRGGYWRAFASASVVPIAAGFKNQAVMIPCVYVALAFACQGSGLWKREHDLKGRRSALVVLVLTTLFSAWYVLEILPLAPQAQHPAFARDWRLGSLGSGYLQLLMAGFNPLAIFREQLGYQEAIPVGFGGPGVAWAALRALFVTGVAGWSAYVARSRKELLLWLLLMTSALALMAFAAAMPNHRYEYYLYFSMPFLALAASYIWAPISGILRSSESQRLAGVLLIFLSLANGILLHSSNGLVRQAENARLGVEFAARLPAETRLHFVRPDHTAWTDLVYGTAVRAMLPGQGIRVTFGHRDAEDLAPRADEDRVLAYFERGERRPGRILTLDSASDVAQRTVSLTAGNSPVSFSIKTSGRPVRGLGLMFGTHAEMRPCKLRIDLYADRSEQGRDVLAQRDLRCDELKDNEFHLIWLDEGRALGDAQLHVDISSDAKSDAEAVALWGSDDPTYQEETVRHSMGFGSFRPAAIVLRGSDGVLPSRSRTLR